MGTLIAAQHAINEIPERSPVIFSAGEVMLVYEQDVMLEARVEMRLESKMHNHGVVMAVDMGVYSVEALKHLTQEARKGLGEWYSYIAK